MKYDYIRVGIRPIARSEARNYATGNLLKSAYSTFVPCAPTQTPLPSHCSKTLGKRLPSAHPRGEAFHLSTLKTRIFAGGISVEISSGKTGFPPILRNGAYAEFGMFTLPLTGPYAGTKHWQVNSFSPSLRGPDRSYRKVILHAYKFLPFGSRRPGVTVHDALHHPLLWPI